MHVTREVNDITTAGKAYSAWAVLFIAPYLGEVCFIARKSGSTDAIILFKSGSRITYGVNSNYMIYCIPPQTDTIFAYCFT